VSTNPELVSPQIDNEVIQQLVDSLGCSTVLATVLSNRGLTDPAEAQRFLNPTAKALHHPSELPDIDATIARAEAAIKRQEEIVVFSDRDVDGITGSAILTELLREYGAPTRPHAPGKWDGYGLSEDHVEDFVQDATDLILCVDCGTTAHDAIDRATDGGVDVVVIDHHNPDETLPSATACVNPRRSESDYPNPDLAAGALAWKVGQALVETHAPLDIEDFHQHALPLAAVATIGDYMPLTLENRAIVREGFECLQKSNGTGLIKAANHCEVDEMRDLRWSLVPLLNAAQEADSGDPMCELLLTRETARIDELIDRFESYRAERKQQRAERQSHLQECFENQVDPETADVFFVKTDQYVGGGPMSQLSKRWHRPVITYRSADSGYKGGGRTAPDVDLLQLYEACEDLLEEFWGHPGAAGFRIAEEHLEPFKRELTSSLRDRYDPAEFRPTIDVDALIDLSDLDTDTVEELDQLRPFGTGHDEPIVLMENVEVVDEERFGDDNRHWKGYLADCDDVTIVDWNSETNEAIDGVPSMCDVAGTLAIDSYNNTVRVTSEAIQTVDGRPKE